MYFGIDCWIPGKDYSSFSVSVTADVAPEWKTVPVATLNPFAGIFDLLGATR
jgi:hypothetical protein